MVTGGGGEREEELDEGNEKVETFSYQKKKVLGNLIKLKSFLHSKVNYKQGEKITLRMGENNSKWNNGQRINFQNIQAAQKTQNQRNKQLNKNGGKT